MNVAVRLPNWLGDTVMAVPVLAAVRAAWPDARVLAAGPWAPLLAGQGLAEGAGVPAVTREPRLAPPAVDAAERAEVLRLLDAAGVPARRAALRFGIQLGAAYGPAKLWPLERVIEFCRLLTARGATPILLGTPGEAPAAARVGAAVSVPSLVGRDRPALLPALLTEIDALVSGDTGVGHLATALGTPSVTLFGPTDPALSAPRGRGAVVTHPVPCAPCFYRACPIEHPCLRGVTPEEVHARAAARGGGGRGHRHRARPPLARSLALAGGAAAPRGRHPRGAGADVSQRALGPALAGHAAALPAHGRAVRGLAADRDRVPRSRDPHRTGLVDPGRGRSPLPRVG